jgi:DNA-binding transcriptional MerR regulator
MDVAKSEPEFYKPAEACRIAEVAPYVLRYWETEFPALSEGKEKGAAKLYSSRDVKIIARIRELLYDEGFTVAGAKKRLEAEIAEGRFDDGLKAAPPPAAQKAEAKAASSPPRAASPEPELAEPAFLSDPPAAARTAPGSSESGFAERKRVVKELKEIVKLLDRVKKK